MCHQQFQCVFGRVPVTSPRLLLPRFGPGVVVCCSRAPSGANEPPGGVISIRLGPQVLSAGPGRQLHKPAPPASSLLSLPRDPRPAERRKGRTGGL